MNVTTFNDERKLIQQKHILMDQNNFPKKHRDDKTIWYNWKFTQQLLPTTIKVQAYKEWKNEQISPWQKSQTNLDKFSGERSEEFANKTNNVIFAYRFFQMNSWTDMTGTFRLNISARRVPLHSCRQDKKIQQVNVKETNELDDQCQKEIQWNKPDENRTWKNCGEVNFSRQKKNEFQKSNFNFRLFHGRKRKYDH